MPYSVNNRSTTQNIDLHALRRWVSMEFGWSQAPELLDDTQIRTVDDTINAGYRLYCYPPTMPQPFSYHPDEVHEWSFLRPTLEILTQSGQHIYPLPLDFERFVGPLVYATLNGQTESYTPIELTSVSRILYLLGVNQDTTQPPLFAATRVAESTGEGSQKQELMLYPVPDGQYLLKAQYQATVRLLTEENPHPLGGQSHGPGILAACLAVAEERIVGEQGPRYKAFLAAVNSAILRDFNRLPGFIGTMNNAHHNYASRSELREAGLLFRRPTEYV